MGLKDAATAAATNKLAEEETRNLQSHHQAGEATVDALAKATGTSSVIRFLNWYRETYPHRPVTSLGDKVQWRGRDIYRLQIDDVIVIRQVTGSALSWALETACSSPGCTHPAFILLTWYVSSSNNAWDAFVLAVGKALKKTEVKCDWCASEIPSTCPTCGRSK